MTEQQPKTPEGATWLPATLALEIEAMTHAELLDLLRFVEAKVKKTAPQ